MIDEEPPIRHCFFEGYCSEMEAPLTREQLWRLVESEDLSEQVHVRLSALIARAGGLTDAVMHAARGEIEKAAATLRLRRTLLVASMFDEIRADAEAMIATELEQVDAIMPELVEAQRAAVEQQQAIAKSMAEIHRIEMEGERERKAIRDKLWLEQTADHDEYMNSLREQSNERNKKFLETLRGSRY